MGSERAGADLAAKLNLAEASPWGAVSLSW